LCEVGALVLIGMMQGCGGTGENGQEEALPPV